ncbi:MAG TPA: hypothetical protein VJT32_03290, partial [bacterium]|nr:hypothetical protein [bacterium]
MHKTEPPREAGVYVVGRPLMFVLWALALWGTMAGAALAVIATTDSAARALHLLGRPFVFLPLSLSVVMWAALMGVLWK